MRKSNRDDGNASLGNAFALIVALILCSAVVGIIAYTQGLESERRYQSPHRHAEVAEIDAKSSCVGAEPSAVFECVYNKVQASEEIARTEQDLAAQQRAASAALASALIALVTLIVSIVGVWYVKRTLDATLQAVEDTSGATEAMRKANDIAEYNARRGMRPYLWPEAAWFEPEENGALTAHVHIKNYGQTPAVNAKGWITTRIRPFPLDDALPEPAPGDVRMGSQIIGHGHHAEYRHPREHPIPPPIAQEIKEGSLAFYVYGYGTYLDTFGKEHFYRYIYFSHGEFFERKRFAPYESGNIIDID